LAKNQDARPTSGGSLNLKTGQLTNKWTCFFPRQRPTLLLVKPPTMRVPPRSPLRLLLAILSVCLLLDTARANPSVPTFDPTDTRPMPTVSLLTMGPGDQAFFKFGHNAIRVRYPGNQGDYVYNFGTFAFDSPTLILDFLTGKFRYWLSVQTFQSTLR